MQTWSMERGIESARNHMHEFMESTDLNSGRRQPKKGPHCIRISSAICLMIQSDGSLSLSLSCRLSGSLLCLSFAYCMYLGKSVVFDCDTLTLSSATQPTATTTKITDNKCNSPICFIFDQSQNWFNGFSSSIADVFVISLRFIHLPLFLDSLSFSFSFASAVDVFASVAAAVASGFFLFDLLLLLLLLVPPNECMNTTFSQ